MPNYAVMVYGSAGIDDDRLPNPRPDADNTRRQNLATFPNHRVVGNIGGVVHGGQHLAATLLQNLLQPPSLGAMISPNCHERRQRRLPTLFKPRVEFKLIAQQ